MNGFTVNQLIKRLQKLADKGHGRQKVVVDIESFPNPLDANLLNIDGVGAKTFYLLDDDGGIRILADGSEQCRTGVVLVGGLKADVRGNLYEPVEQSEH